MNRVAALAFVLVVFLVAGTLPAEAQFGIHAASAAAVQGWDRIQVGNRTLWVSPEASLTSTDIASAEQTRVEDRRAVAVTFNEAGSKKMRELTIAQKDKLVAVIVDGSVIFAPAIRSEISSAALITGNGPDGLSAAQTDRLLASLKR